MYSCASCGKGYKHQGGLNNHVKRCGAASASSASMKKTISENKKTTDGAAAAAAVAAATTSSGSGGSNNVVTNTSNTSNTGNEEHNATFNIKYVKRSEETQEVVKSIVAKANEFCKGRIIVTSDEPAPGGGPLTGIHMSVNDNGTTVYNHPIRTISIIETPPEDYSPEEEHEITLEKMTYLILSLIQNNNKLKKENHILRSIVARIDPACFEDDE
jgi:galactitol-specific phosphotransferase system IIB component